MPAFVKAFFGFQAVKSHCPGSTQWDLRDLHGPCVQPDLRWGCSRGVTPEEEAAAPNSCCTIQGNQECVLCSIPHQKQTPQLAPHHPRNLISLSMVLVCHRILPWASLLFSPRKRKAGNRAALLSSFAYLEKNPQVYFSYLWFYLSVQLYQIKHRFCSGWILKGKWYFLSTFCRSEEDKQGL